MQLVNTTVVDIVQSYLEGICPYCNSSLQKHEIHCIKNNTQQLELDFGGHTNGIRNSIVVAD